MRIEIGAHLIRSFAADDAAALVKYANNANVSGQLRDRFPFPYTAADANSWLEVAMGQDPETNFAIASAEELIGGIGIELGVDIHCRSAEIGYWLGEPHWGKGIASRAVRAIADWAFERFDIVRLFAGVYETNPASARVLEKSGFVLEGRLRKNVSKRGRLLDQLVYGLVRPGP